MLTKKEKQEVKRMIKAGDDAGKRLRSWLDRIDRISSGGKKC
jgi:hypothetical protein